jgi:hypothetical protein
MTIAWMTQGQAARPAVRFGPDGAMAHVQEARSVVLPEGEGGFTHVARITGLEPSTTYHHTVGDLKGTPWSPRATFTTAGSFRDNLTFLVVGDTGVGPNAIATLDRIASENHSFSLHVGDLSYATTGEGWNRFFELTEENTRSHPWMFAMGNHDHHNRTGFASYDARVFTPGPGPEHFDNGSARFYSFNHSSVHITVLDNHWEDYPLNTSFDPPQIAWIEHDLRAAANDPAHPWRVVVMHYPILSAALDGKGWGLGWFLPAPLSER